MWKNTFRNKGTYIFIFFFALLFGYSAYTGWDNYTTQQQIRSDYQKDIREKWENKPDKHPHRMAHYGYLIFRPKHPLSFFDFGIENYVGNSVFLEAHRQNSANFSEASFSTGALRFGELSIAMILQILFPLFIFFIGFGCISKEREDNTLKLLLGQGIAWKDILIGKFLGLFSIVNILFVPVIMGVLILWLSLSIDITGDVLARILLLFLFYTIYTFILCWVVVWISAFSRTAKSSLLSLISIWLLFIIILPRSVQAIGAYASPSLTRVDFESQVEEDLLKNGDSHNPDDVHFKKLKDSLLSAYKVDSTSQLPFNYGGFVMKEGEKLNAITYDKHLKKLIKTYHQQNEPAKLLAFVDPFVAVKNISMALTETGFMSYDNFQKQVEIYRYHLSQKMNELQINLVSNNARPDGKPITIDKSNWKSLPDFHYQYASVKQVLKTEWTSLLSLTLWLLSSIVLLKILSKKLKAL